MLGVVTLMFDVLEIAFRMHDSPAHAVARHLPGQTGRFAQYIDPSESSCLPHGGAAAVHVPHVVSHQQAGLIQSGYNRRHQHVAVWHLALFQVTSHARERSSGKGTLRTWWNQAPADPTGFSSIATSACCGRRKFSQ